MINWDKNVTEPPPTKSISIVDLKKIGSGEKHLTDFIPKVICHSIGKKHSLKKYDQFVRNTSCFCTVWFSQEHIFCNFNNGKKSIFSPEKSVKQPKILFFSVQKLQFW